ncbi:hypothetical protein BAQU_1742 [Bifidobacterium aquikefiri]|uniref:Uncharacterized protein n=1 Tax=Bifidobacterium aquikefiri TaxID=1653207 RepID=A0A261G297_9BIFI|nr:hypothetical protein BAQU_1742 [Bifidobacterium aquikefiri]
MAPSGGFILREVHNEHRAPHCEGLAALCDTNNPSLRRHDNNRENATDHYKIRSTAHRQHLDRHSSLHAKRLFTILTSGRIIGSKAAPYRYNSDNEEPRKTSIAQVCNRPILLSFSSLTLFIAPSFNGLAWRYSKRDRAR